MDVKKYVGASVHVHTEKYDYTGWLAAVRSDETVVLRDATRTDGRRFDVVVVTEPLNVTDVGDEFEVRRIDIENVVASEYDVREGDVRMNWKTIRKEVRKGHPATFPIVREVAESEYELLDGFRRVERAKEINLATIPVKIIDIDDKKAARRFVEEHVPLPAERGVREHTFESEEKFERVTELLTERWSREQLRNFFALEPELRRLDGRDA